MLRKVLLLAGVLPIILAARTLADWARNDPNATAERNRVWRCGRAHDDYADLGRSPHRPPGRLNHDLRDVCEVAAEQWTDRLSTDYNVVVRAPFVLVGNVSKGRLTQVYSDTLFPAANALQRRYFHHKPDQAITVLLLKDESSYRRFAAQLFGQNNVSIYGYYKPSSRTIVLNLDAGEGTLVHELVHALADFDFPQLPIWLNEGMATLYEQCALGHDLNGPTIVPLVNWRLSVLHEAMADGELKTIQNLASCANFRGPHEAIKYAQARYLCMFLYVRGLLESYYHRFRANCHQDPTGVATLSATFNDRSLSSIDESFRRWAFGLQVPQSGTRHRKSLGL